MPAFSVIIVSHGLEDHGRLTMLQAAVDSLKRQTVSNFELFLVDNSERDGGLDLIDTGGLAAVHRLEWGGNHGFAKGNNLAAAQARSDWLVLLNPDAVAAPNWLEAIQSGIDRHPNTVMFASLQICLEDESRIDGIGDCFFGFGIAWRGGFGRPVSDIPDEGTCFSPCGAGAIYRRDDFVSHGGFDEDFFCFGEDTDLAYRLRLSGNTCVFLPSAMIRHAGGGVSGRTSDFSVRHGARNRIWGYVKTTPPLLFWATLPGHLLLTSAILARGLMTGRFGPTLAGVTEACSKLGLFLEKRKRLQATRTCGSGELAAAMAWNPLKLVTRRGDVRPFKR